MNIYINMQDSAGNGCKAYSQLVGQIIGDEKKLVF